MVANVFISYTSDDVRQARSIASALAENDFAIWLADRNLPAGARLSAITDQLERADHVVILLSQAALKSKWVRYEMETSVALQLQDRRAIQVIPLFLEPVPPPAVIAGLVGIDFYRERDDLGVRHLVAILRGEEWFAQDRYTQFRAYVGRLVQLDRATFDSVNTLAIFARRDSSESEEDRRTRARARAAIAEKLASGAVDAAQRERILKAFDAAHPLPIIERDSYAAVISWLRNQGNQELLDFAVELWRGTKGLRGITARWIEAFLEQATRGANQTGLRAEMLGVEVDRLSTTARNAGLLTASSEWNAPGTTAYFDAQINPSYDIGPMTAVIGRLVDGFQHETNSLPS